MWLGGAIAEERLSLRPQPRRATTVPTYETRLQGRQATQERGRAREARGHTPKRVGEEGVLQQTGEETVDSPPPMPWQGMVGGEKVPNATRSGTDRVATPYNTGMRRILRPFASVLLLLQ